MFGKQSVTKINCVNFDETVAFYRDRLHLRILEQHDGATVFDTGHGGELIITSQPSEPTVDIAFTDVDIPSAHEALADLGTTEIFGHKTGERFEVYDPAGTKVIFVNA